jgi:mannose-6-phosphate isomerase
MLTYSYGPPTFLKATTFGTSKTTLLYTPPLKPHPEFNVLFTTLHNESEVINLGGPSMVLVTGGQGSFSADGKSVSVGRGSCFFVGEGLDFKMEHSSEDGESLVVWRAFCAI